MPILTSHLQRLHFWTELSLFADWWPSSHTCLCVCMCGCVYVILIMTWKGMVGHRFKSSLCQSGSFCLWQACLCKHPIQIHITLGTASKHIRCCQNTKLMWRWRRLHPNRRQTLYCCQLTGENANEKLLDLHFVFVEFCLERQKVTANKYHIFKLKHMLFAMHSCPWCQLT